MVRSSVAALPQGHLLLSGPYTRTARSCRHRPTQVAYYGNKMMLCTFQPDTRPGPCFLDTDRSCRLEAGVIHHCLCGRCISQGNIAFTPQPAAMLFVLRSLQSQTLHRSQFPSSHLSQPPQPRRKGRKTANSGSPCRCDAFYALLNSSGSNSRSHSTPAQIAQELPPKTQQQTSPLTKPQSLHQRLKMLLPSALPCDARPRHPRTQNFSTTTPPLSDSSTPVSPLTTGIYTTCRALQTLLSGPSSTTPPQSPPLRSSKRTLQSPITIKPTLYRANPRTRPPPPRSATKRRRDPLDECDRSVDPTDRYTTPKRQRLAPPVLPLGLSPSDFESPSHPQPTTPEPQTPQNRSDFNSFSAPPNSATSTSNWSAPDDRALVALVLSKMKLSRREWNECARRLGRDREGVGARWRTLVGEGRVGMRKERERGKGLWT